LPLLGHKESHPGALLPNLQLAVSLFSPQPCPLPKLHLVPPRPQPHINGADQHKNPLTESPNMPRITSTCLLPQQPPIASALFGRGQRGYSYPNLSYERLKTSPNLHPKRHNHPTSHSATRPNSSSTIRCGNLTHFFKDPIYLQSVIIHLANGGKGEGWHVEEFSVALLC
jgi:hypothetical protein